MKEAGFMETGGLQNRETKLLLRHEKPNNAFEHQVMLAAELFERDKGKVKVFDHATKEAVMEYWQNHGYVAVFGDLVRHSDFKTHRRFKNDPLNVTLADVEYYLRHKHLPE